MTQAFTFIDIFAENGILVAVSNVKPRQHFLKALDLLLEASRFVVVSCPYYKMRLRALVPRESRNTI